MSASSSPLTLRWSCIALVAAGCSSGKLSADGASGGKGGATIGNFATAQTGGGFGTGGSSTGGSGSSDTSGGERNGGSAAVIDIVGYCSSPIALASDEDIILDFDSYDGTSNLDGWYETKSSGVLLGPYGYGDGCDASVTNCLPETVTAPLGYGDTGYAYEVADTEATEFGGGSGVWINGCLDGSVFDGISFWAKGFTPTGKVKLILLMGDTVVENDDGTGGFCVETSSDPENYPSCLSPSYSFTLPTDASTWQNFKIPWAAFAAGKGNGVAVQADGRNIVQIRFSITLNWVPESEGSSTYVPVPAPYDFTFDNLAFY